MVSYLLVSLIFLLNSLTTVIHANPSRVQLLRALERVDSFAPQKAAGPVSPGPAAATTPAAPTNGVPLPTIPPQPANFTSEQKTIYEALIQLGTQLKNPKDFTEAAKKLRDLIDGSKIGTSPRTIIAQRGELQQTLLAVMFHCLSKNDIQNAPELSTDQKNDAVAAGQALYHELTRSEWLTLNIPLNKSLAGQEQNAEDRYSDFTDAVLTPNELDILKSVEASAQAATHISLLTLPGGLQSASKMIEDLKENYRKLSEAKLAKKSAEARAAVEAIAKMDIPEGLDENTKKTIAALITSLREDAKNLSQMATNKTSDSLREMAADLADTQTPQSELADLSEELRTALYENPANFAVAGQNKLRAAFFSAPQVVPTLTVMCARINFLLADAVSRTTSVASPATEALLLPFLWLPADFFSGFRGLLETHALDQQKRDAFVAAASALFGTLKKNRLIFGIKDAYGQNTIDTLLTAVLDLSLGSSAEGALYKTLQELLQDVRAAIIRMAESFNVTGLPFIAPTDQTGKVISYPAVLTRRTAIAPTAAPADTYAFLIKELIAAITTNEETIIGNEKLYSLLLDTATSLEQEYVPQKLRRHLEAATQMSTETFFALKKEMQDKVEARTGKTFPSPLMKAVQQEIVTPFAAMLIALYGASAASPQRKLLPGLFASDDTTEKVLTAFEGFEDVINQPARADITSALTDDVILRSLLFEPYLSISKTDFFSDAQKINSKKSRYRLSAAGYTATATLIAAETKTDGTSLYLAPLNELLSLFKALGLNPEEQSQLDLLTQTTRQVSTVIAGYATASPAEQSALLTKYEASMSVLAKKCTQDDTRLFIGFNYFAHALFFTDDGFFITTIPEKLSAGALKDTESCIKAVLDNEKDFNYARDPRKESIVLALKKVLSDTKKNESALADQLSPEESTLYNTLTAAALNLKDKKTYQAGLMAIYAALTTGGNKDLVGKEKVLFNVLFSADKGVFVLPPEVSLSAPASTALDDMALFTGAALFKFIKENPHDLGYKGNALVEGLVAKMLAFFTTATAPKKEDLGPQGDTTNAADTAAAVSAEKEAVQKKTAANPDTASAEQLVSYLREHAADLTDTQKIDDFIDAMTKQVDSAKKRQNIANNAELKKLFFSADGILIAPEKLPNYIKKSDLDDAIKFYKIIKDNPKELGYKTASAEVNPVNIAVGKILDRLKKLLDIANDPNMNYEDLDGYFFDAPDKTGKTKGYVPRNIMLLTGNIEDPVEALGAKIADRSLQENGWSVRQIDLYNYIYSEGYRNMRSPFMTIFSATLNKIDSLCKLLDKDESFITQGNRLDRLTQTLRLLNKKPLEIAFQAAVMSIPFLPNDIAEKTWNDERAKGILFYQYLLDNQKRFEIKAEQVGSINNIITWLQDPKNKAPDRIQVAAMNGKLTAGGTFNGEPMSANMMSPYGAPFMGAMPFGMGGKSIPTGQGPTAYNKGSANARAQNSDPLMSGGFGAGGMMPMPGMMMPGMPTPMGGLPYGYNPGFNPAMPYGAGMPMPGMMMPGMMQQPQQDVETKIELALLKDRLQQQELQAVRDQLYSLRGGGPPLPVSAPRESSAADMKMKLDITTPSVTVAPTPAPRKSTVDEAEEDDNRIDAAALQRIAKSGGFKNKPLAQIRPEDLNRQPAGDADLDKMIAFFTAGTDALQDADNVAVFCADALTFIKQNTKLYALARTASNSPGKVNDDKYTTSKLASLYHSTFDKGSGINPKSTNSIALPTDAKALQDMRSLYTYVVTEKSSSLPFSRPALPIDLDPAVLSQLKAVRARVEKAVSESAGTTEPIPAPARVEEEAEVADDTPTEKREAAASKKAAAPNSENTAPRSTTFKAQRLEVTALPTYSVDEL